MLAARGAETFWYDPHVSGLPQGIPGTHQQEWTREAIDSYDAVVIVTPHKGVDHTLLLGAAPVVVDTRNALKGHTAENLVKL